MCLRPVFSAMSEAVTVLPTPGVPVTSMFGRFRSVWLQLSSLIFSGFGAGMMETEVDGFWLERL